MFFEYTRIILKKSLLLGELTACALLLMNDTNLVLGFLLGYGVSALNFFMLTRDVGHLVASAPRRYSSILIKRFFLRYGMIALALICVATYGLHVGMFIIGVFFIQLMLFIDNGLVVKKSV